MEQNLWLLTLRTTGRVLTDCLWIWFPKSFAQRGFLEHSLETGPFPSGFLILSLLQPVPQLLYLLLAAQVMQVLSLVFVT